MNGGTGFNLLKWYADCVSDAGEVIIAYVASMCWRGLHLHYSNVLSADAAGKTESAGTILDVALPSNENDAFHWSSRTLDFEGTWSPLQRPIEQTIYSSSNGSITWECLQPLSDVKITFKNKSISGLGYVERIHMNVPPWTLPIDRLNWGRFLARDTSVVWIDWRGKYSTQHIWINGERRPGTIQDHRLMLEPYSLGLEWSSVLREGVLGRTALSFLPAWIKPVPGKVLGIHETKWRSRGGLAVPGARTIEGWAIHEVVQWPK